MYNNWDLTYKIFNLTLVLPDGNNIWHLEA